MLDFFLLVVTFFVIEPITRAGCVEEVTWEPDEAKASATCKESANNNFYGLMSGSLKRITN